MSIIYHKKGRLVSLPPLNTKTINQLFHNDGPNSPNQSHTRTNYIRRYSIS
jgi:hypothetical protein